MAREKSPDYGVLQEFIDRLFDGREDYMRLEVVLEGEAYGLNGGKELPRTWRARELKRALQKTHR